MNGGYLDTESRTLFVNARLADVSFFEDGGQVTISVENFDEGIEIPHDGPTWRSLGG